MTTTKRPHTAYHPLPQPPRQLDDGEEEEEEDDLATVIDSTLSFFLQLLAESVGR